MKVSTKCLLFLLPLFLFSLEGLGNELRESNFTQFGTDDRPELSWEVHILGNLWSAILNNGTFADPNGNFSSMEWPGGSGNYYLWSGDFWSACAGEITSTWPDSAGKWASCSDYGDYEFTPSDGYPMERLVPGDIGDEQIQCGYDDWYTEGAQDNPYGLGVWQESYTWTASGYDNFIVNKFAITHHSEFGNGNPLDGYVSSIRGDCDISTSDTLSCALDDMVYYDGHAIWANGSYSFEYIFDGGVNASEQDVYTYQQNPDNPLPSTDPQNIFYHYNYLSSDGIPDNDVDQNGVSDHFTILAKVVGSDTLYLTDPVSGIELFSAGMPYYHYTHTVADTTYLVVPRNLSYMWDSDAAGSTEDDSGEPMISDPCNGFIGWRLLDMYVVKADQTIERPADVWGYPIPLSHTWWNWESDPSSDTEKYHYSWGLNPDASGATSGPLYLSDWVGNPNTPVAMNVANPGPFPIVHDSPLNLGYPTFDYRFLITTAPVELCDGDSLFVIGGWVMGLGLDGLRMNADLMLDAYYRASVWGPGLGIEDGSGVGSMQSTLNITPNPCSGNMLSANFITGEPSSASLTVYDVSGRMVQNNDLGDFEAGLNSVDIGASTLSNGMYFALVTTERGTARGKFVILR